MQWDIIFFSLIGIHVFGFPLFLSCCFHREPCQGFSLLLLFLIFLDYCIYFAFFCVFLSASFFSALLSYLLNLLIHTEGFLSLPVLTRGLWHPAHSRCSVNGVEWMPTLFLTIPLILPPIYLWPTCFPWHQFSWKNKVTKYNISVTILFFSVSSLVKWGSESRWFPNAI